MTVHSDPRATLVTQSSTFTQLLTENETGLMYRARNLHLLITITSSPMQHSLQLLWMPTTQQAELVAECYFLLSYHEVLPTGSRNGEWRKATGT